jgi:GT2 family glycosyltransferase
VEGAKKAVVRSFNFQYFGIMKKLYIVVLNYNGGKDTVACLRSLKKVGIPKGLEMEILVVDNGSEDGSVDAIEEFRSSGVQEFKKKREHKFEITIIRNNENYGYAKGNNVGIKYALDSGADYVLVLNNDTTVDPDFLKELLDGAERHPQAGMLASKIYFAKGKEFHKDRYKKSDMGKVIWAAGGAMDWDNVYGVNIGIDEVDVGQFDPPGGGDKQVEKAPGTCVLMTKKMLEEVAGFDEKFFMYFEDDDLSIRVKGAGFEIWYIPTAKVWHVSGASSGIGSGLMDYFTTRNRMLFGMRYARWRTKLALVRESFRLFFRGREWQRRGVRDFYLRRWGRGSWGG